ncbi:MAG: hypothetical protein AAFY65_01245 [Pseudomonadota bacterium]
MDRTWFDERMRQNNVTSADVARAADKARTGLSNILSGKQRMTTPWAEALASLLNEPITEIFVRAGVLRREEVSPQPLAGMSEPDVVPFQHSNTADMNSLEKLFGADRPGIDVWQVRSNGLAAMGYLRDDFVVVDSHASERARMGDAVIAQIYDRNGDAATVLRRFEPPVLIDFSPDPTERHVQLVDHDNVVIRGVVTASWRSRT